MAHVIVRVEGREPHHAAVATLHPPHPLHSLRIEPAHGAVEGDTAEDLHLRYVRAREPRAVGGDGDVALEHHRFHLARGGERGELVVVHGAAEDIGRGVGVEVDEPRMGLTRGGGGE